jgi:hypothetical protein
MPPKQQQPIIRYRDLIARARCEGLVSISTELIQIPTAENGQTAIARALVTFADADGRTRSFEDYGDACPTNVGPIAANALIRMSITRAKGRCLRDALGVGDVMAEELSDSVESNGSTARRTNESGAPCPTCNAPSGRMHATSCRG